MTPAPAAATPPPADLYRLLVEQAEVGLFVIQHQRFRYVNPRLLRMFGREVAEMLAMAALQALPVVPGHFVPGKHSGTQVLQYTRDYLDAIEAEQAQAANSAALVDAMKRRYPDAQLPIALDIGAKVIKGEMKW